MGLLAMIAGRGLSVALFSLGGMMIAALAGALVSLVISLSPFAFDLSGTVSWTTGALTDRSWADVGIVLLLTGLGLGTLARAGRGLDAMSLGRSRRVPWGYGREGWRGW
jgi:iron complex transport system permease protein